MMQYKNLVVVKKKDFQRLVEGLYVLAIEDEDFDILNKYFG